MGRKNKTPPPQRPDAHSPNTEGRRKPRPIPAWQIALLALSVLLMLAGGGAWLYTKTLAPKPNAASNPDQSPDSLSPGSTGGLAQGLTSGFAPAGPANPSTSTSSTATPEPSEPSPLETYSPAVFRLGFSFFAGFAMAYALRQFLKITLLLAGVILLGMFALQYAGLVQIDWKAIEGKYNTVAAFLSEQTRSFTAFVSGYLPSATSAAAGAFLGFRKK